MRIVRLKLTNFACFEEEVFEFGQFNKITGRNGSGKSTLIDAIQTLLLSKGAQPDKIRVGSDKTTLEAELDRNGDQVDVNRSMKPTGSKSAVKVNSEKPKKKVGDKDEEVKPQDWLFDNFDPHSFNPVHFIQADKPERRKILLKAFPMTFTPGAIQDAIESIEEGLSDLLATCINVADFDWDQHGLIVMESLYDVVYEKRKEKNVAAIQLRKAVKTDRDELPATYDGEKYSDFDLNGLTNKLSDAKAAISHHNRDVEQLAGKKQRRNSLQSQVIGIDSEIADIQRKIKEAQSRKVELEEELSNVISSGKELQDKVDGFTPPEIQEIQTRIDEYEKHQEVGLRLKDIERREGQAEKIEAEHARLEKLVNALRTDIPQNLLSDVKLPVEGLRINGDEITIDGVPLDQKSRGQQARFAHMIAEAVVPKEAFICVDNLQDIDPEVRDDFEDQVMRSGRQHFVCETTRGDFRLETVNSIEELESMRSRRAQEDLDLLQKNTEVKEDDRF